MVQQSSHLHHQALEHTHNPRSHRNSPQKHRAPRLRISDIWKPLINKYTDTSSPPTPPPLILPQQSPVHQPPPPAELTKQPPASHYNAQQTTADNNATYVGDTHSESPTPHPTNGYGAPPRPQAGDLSPGTRRLFPTPDGG